MLFFFEFSIRGRVGNNRNDNFSFHSFSAFPNLFWPEKWPYWCFIIFWIFLLFFFNSLLRIRKEIPLRKFYFHSFAAFPNVFSLEKMPKWCFFFFNFFNFFDIFLELSITGRVGNDWNVNFYFHSFSAFPNLFCLENKL